MAMTYNSSNQNSPYSNYKLLFIEPRYHPQPVDLQRTYLIDSTKMGFVSARSHGWESGVTGRSWVCSAHTNCMSPVTSTRMSKRELQHFLTALVGDHSTGYLRFHSIGCIQKIIKEREIETVLSSQHPAAGRVVEKSPQARGSYSSPMNAFELCFPTEFVTIETNKKINCRNATKDQAGF